LEINQQEKTLAQGLLILSPSIDLAKDISVVQSTRSAFFYHFIHTVKFEQIS